ncbi:MAG: carboxypeptidase regulatory-like domain-containing protein [Terracidiphilus sp.]
MTAVVVAACISTVVAFAQNQAAQVSGLITDPSGAVVINAAVDVVNQDNGVAHHTQSNAEGYYVVPLLQPGRYKITVTASHFDVMVRDGIELAGTQNARVDFALKMGNATQTVNVYADAAQIDQENAQLGSGIPPATLESLPLIVAGGPRNMSGLVTLMPGVSSPNNTPTTSHMNGGLAYEQETILDGVGIAYASGGSGMFNLTTDFPQSPDMIREINVLTSNYAPEYGNSAAASIILETKSGTEKFHGVAFDYLRNTDLNAASYGAGGVRSTDIENEFGGSIGGPIRIPKIQTAKSRPFFFAIWEGYRSAGSPSRPVLTIPSAKERAGDFTDWVDSSGNLIPVYDPATTVVSGSTVTRSQFMGCDGKTPNVICSTDSRLTGSLATKWLQYLPTPTSSGALDNYTPDHSNSTIYSNRDTIDSRIDENYGDKDHFSASYYRMSYVGGVKTLLPAQLSTEVACNGACVNTMVRLNEDHTFGPTLLNHFAYGLTRAGNGKEDYPNQQYVSDLPTIAGVPYPQYTAKINFSDGFESYDGSSGSTGWSNINIWNDMLEWSHGAHVIKVGGEYRRIAINESGSGTPGGSFSFARGETGLAGVVSGNPIAAFLLGQVDSGTATVYGEGGVYNPRQYVAVLHAGDTWKIFPKLSLSYGLRWDLHPPSTEKHDKMSFFDPTGLNTDAGDLPGRLAFAGKEWGTASYGERYPETVVLTDFAPRLGFAYSLNDKTVVRGGYGIFYSDAKYPGWGMGVSTNGFDANPSFSSSLGGLQAAFVLSSGLPTTYTKPPFIESSYLNGQSGPLYRPVDSNHTPYSQQWDLVVERQITNNLYASAGYTGNRGTHLYSYIASPNTLNPGLLSMGSKLNDEFSSSATSLDGVSAPYTAWESQMTGCSASVAQALLPFPQYCGDIHAVNENKGISEYHSLQVKVEKRATENGYVLVDYTFSKLLTNVDTTQPGNEFGGLFSPYQRWRNWGLATSDIKQAFTAAYVYHLPFGHGKKWLNSGSLADRLAGGWETSGALHINGAPPFYFRSSTCNVPSQFDVQCVPAIIAGANPLAQSKKNFNPAKSLFNSAAFEQPSVFNYYAGAGSRVSNLRGFPYHNEDLALDKNIAITERVGFQLRAEAFNIWNWHVFQNQGNNFSTSTSAFSTDIGSSGFGIWNGDVTSPRNIQVAGRLTF